MKKGMLLERSSVQKIFSKTYKNKEILGLYFRCIIEALVIALLLSYLFYNSVKMCIFLAPFMVFYVMNRMKKENKRDKERIAKSFKDGMQAVRNSMQTGYSIENSFRQAIEQLEVLYGNKNKTYIGFLKISKLLSLNIPIEDAFKEFAYESEVEEIIYFSEILGYAKRNGGNLAEIIKDTSEIIEEKIDVKSDIDTVIYGKKFEQKIMCLIPMGIILYMRFSSLNVIEKLYNNAMGKVVMTVCLGIYMTSYFLSEKITDIVV